MKRIRMTKKEYEKCLRELVLVLVQTHGQMTVRALHERCNKAIMDYGIDRAPNFIRMINAPTHSAQRATP